jgi:hydroxymethylpyrimidine pyrophosphatase-like HAD family hydrolase
MIIFDWDGTAVPDRHSPIGDLQSALERILKEGALCAIVTGTNLDTILKQGIETLTCVAKQGLHICTNRGSEVYDFNSLGNPRLIFRRQATASENLSLDNAARGLHNRIQTQDKGMKTEVILNRLNRRKVDLIPEPKWTSPKKAQFRELLSAVEARMAKSGISGGIPQLIKEAEEISRQAGLSHPKITSDLKHIEIGLTDKGDSASWIARNIIDPGKISLTRVSVWGDELGSQGSLPGSDALMRTPELREASFFSVGVEPEGVPSWVHSLGGGPARFIKFLHLQSGLRQQSHIRQQSDPRRTDPTPTQDCTWVLEQEGFDPTRERLTETLFAIGNGNLGVRWTSDLPIPAAHADLFVAGIYDQRIPSQP